MSGFMPIALEGTAVQPYALPMQYQQLQKAAAEVPLTQAQTEETQQRAAYTAAQVPYVQAQTVGEQIKNALGQLNLAYRGWGYNEFTGAGANANEPLPGQAPGAYSGDNPYAGAQPGSGVAVGMRQANPLNLEDAGQAGALPKQGRFAAFPNMATGVAATADQLVINQQQHGMNTVRQMATRWVSDPGADLVGVDPATGKRYTNAAGQPVAPGSYVADTAKALGVGPDDPINWSDPRVQQAYIMAAQPHESAGGGAVLDAADVQRGVQLAATRRGGAAQPYQVAQAGGGWQPPPSQPGGQAGQLAAAGGQTAPGQPNVLAAHDNPMGTSSQGRLIGGVALPRWKIGLAMNSPDPGKAMTDAMVERRNTLSTMAGAATDDASWNQAVAQAWRQGYLTNGEFQHFYGHFDGGRMRDTVIRSLSSPETQVGYNQSLFQHGFDTSGPSASPALKPAYKAGEAPVELAHVPVYDQQTGELLGTRPETIPAQEYYRRFGQYPPGAGTPGGVAGGAGGVAPPAQAGQVQVRGTDGQWYQVPAGAGPAAAQGTGAAPAPAGGGPAPATPAPAGGAAAPPVASGAGAAATPAPQQPPTPGAVSVGNIEYTPQLQRRMAADAEAMRADQAYVTAAQDEQRNAQQQQQQILNTRAVGEGLGSGAFGPVKAATSNYVASLFPSVAKEWLEKVSGLDIDKDAAAWQEFAKLTLGMTGQAASQVAGGHTGFNVVHLYQGAFPGLETQPAAVHDMMNLFLIQHQYAVDHAQAVSSYAGAAREANLRDPVHNPYVPANQAVDQAFLSPTGLHAPSVYVAAAALLNGKADALNGLGSDQQRAQAYKIALAADPTWLPAPAKKAP